MMRTRAALTLGLLAVSMASRAPAAEAPPAVTSANLAAHFAAGDINRGAPQPAHGANVTAWSDLVSGDRLLVDALGFPVFIAAGHDGINGLDTVRMTGVAGDLDILFNNSLTFAAQTVVAVVTMATNDWSLSTLLCNGSHNLSIRETTSVVPAYFSGNSGDFVVNGGSGTLYLNGSPRLDIPGGYGAAHVVTAKRAAATTYAGFRFGDNVGNAFPADNRRWQGDIAEVLVYDGQLDGNDTALVNRYLETKYAIPQVVDEKFGNARQLADQPFGPGSYRYVGVNFYYAPGGDTTGKVCGIGFDNINMGGWTPSPGPFVLQANPPAVTLAVAWSGFTIDNTYRTQAPGIVGADSNTLNAVAGEMFYLSNPANTAADHRQATLTFSGLGPKHPVYVQVIGGDSGWYGDVGVRANGETKGTWMSVADGSGATASLFACAATTDASGSLQLDFNVTTNNYSGIGGLLLAEWIPSVRGTVVIFR